MSTRNSTLRDDLNIEKGLTIKILKKLNKGSMVWQSFLEKHPFLLTQVLLFGRGERYLWTMSESPIALELLSEYNEIPFLHATHLLNTCLMPGKMLWAKDTALRGRNDPIGPVLMDLQPRDREKKSHVNA